MDALKGGKYEFITLRNKQNFKRDLTKFLCFPTKNAGVMKDLCLFQLLRSHGCALIS